MARIEPLPSSETNGLEDVFEPIEAQGARIPNMYLTLARQPEILRAVAATGTAIMGPGSLPADLKALVAFVASNTAGCRFCSAHTSRQALSASVSMTKLRCAFEYEDNPVFSPSERAALGFARDSALHPSGIEDAHIAALKVHFSIEQIIELIAITCLFAFMNRWHDIVQTDLEPGYDAFIEEHLTPNGWPFA
jgi:uncharacterized peroxidase-related enzyme